MKTTGVSGDGKAAGKCAEASVPLDRARGGAVGALMISRESAILCGAIS
jgi:hypothetical protein